MPIPSPNNGVPRGGCDCLPRPAGDAPAMPPPNTYVLRYEDRWFGIEKHVAFEAADLVAALALAESEPVGSGAELSDGEGVLICRRGGALGAADYWSVD